MTTETVTESSPWMGFTDVTTDECTDVVIEPAVEKTGSVAEDAFNEIVYNDLCTRVKDRPYVRVASFDGGGCRGLISATLLAELTKRVRGLSDGWDRQPGEFFDVVAGTSIGGLTAGTITLPAPDGSPLYSADQVVDAYIQHAEEIFYAEPGAKVKAFGGIRKEIYDPSGLENCLDYYIGDSLVRDATAEVILPVIDTLSNSTAFVSKSLCTNHPLYRETKLWDVVRGGTAAPVYFPAHETEIGGERRNLIDAGLGVNSPSAVAYSHALAAKGNPDEVVVVSFGTGNVDKSLYTQGWGAWQWLPNLIPVMFKCQGDSAHMQMMNLMPCTGDDQRYFRWQPDLAPEQYALDNAEMSNLLSLQDTANFFIEEHEDELNRAARLLITEPEGS